MKKPSVSVVIPAYNEQESIKPLYKELKGVLDRLIKSNEISKYEVIFINDGSIDTTQKSLDDLKKSEKSRLKTIEFRRNFGKAEAYKAGFELASGDLIFTMDSDLQDNPNDLPKFLEKINAGADMVVGWKYKRKDPITKRFPSRIFNFVMRAFTGVYLHDCDNGYRCIKKEILPHLDLYEGLYRYIPVFAKAKGFKLGEVKVNHRERKFGESKYGVSRLFKGFFDLITIKFIFDYLKRPLHFFGGIGAMIFSLGFVVALYLTYIKFFLGELIGNRPLLTFSVLAMVIGLQFIFFGLLGEMIANLSKKEKHYVIRKTV